MCTIENYNANLEDKILKGEELTESEVQDIIYENYHIEKVSSHTFGETRWGIIEEIIIKIRERYFSLFYIRGKTERQDDEFEAQIAEEVVPKEVVSVIYVRK